MKNIILRILTLAVAETWFACAGMAQANQMPLVKDSILNPVLKKDAAKILSFDKIVAQIGTLTEDDKPVDVTFVFTNVSNENIHIERVSTTCGCTLADFTIGIIKPGGKGSIKLTYNPFNHPGTIDTNAFVYLLGKGKQPLVKLTILGMVVPGQDAWARYPYTLCKLRMKRRGIEFNEVKSGSLPSERILCGNSGKVSLKPKAILMPPFASFHSEPEIIEPGEEADLVITLDESKIPAAKGKNFSFPVILDNIGNCRPSDRTIEVKVKRIE